MFFLFLSCQITSAQGWPFRYWDWINIGETTVFNTEDNNFIHGMEYANQEGELLFRVSLLDQNGVVQWVKEFNEAHSIIGLENDFFLVVGSTINLLNTEGNIIFTEFLGEEVNAATATKDGGFIIAGFQSRETPLLRRYDHNQNIVWTDTLPVVTSPNIPFRTAEIIELDNGNLMLTGWNVGKANNHIFQYTQDGEELWELEFPSTDSVANQIRKIYPTSGGEFIIAGANAIAVTGLAHDLIVGKIRSTGEVVWLKSYDFLFDDTFLDFSVTPQGEIVVLGSAVDGNVFPAPVSPVLFKLDNTGNVIWQKSEGNGIEESLKVLYDAIGPLEREGFYVLGSSKKVPADNRGLPIAYYYNYDGEIIDSTFYFQNAEEQVGGGRMDQMIRAIDGSLIISGVLYGRPLAFKQAFVIKEKALVSSIEHPLEGTEYLKVFPNPSKGIIHFEVLKTVSKQIQFSLFDQLGRRVYSNIFIGNTFQVARKELGLSNGNYFFQINIDGQVIKAGKIIFQ